MKKYLKMSFILTLCCVFVMALVGTTGCGDEEPTKPTEGTITGRVCDVENEALSDATIYYTEEDFVESDEDGNFKIDKVTVGDISLTVSLSGYAEQVKTLTADSFDNEGNAHVNVVMEEGMGTITGTVTLDGNSSVKLANVTIKMTGDKTATVTTGADGKYTIENVPMLNKKTITATLAGYEEASKNVTTGQYKNGTATVNMTLTESDLKELPGLKPSALKADPISADKLVIKSKEIEDYFVASRDNLQGTSKIDRTHSEGFCLNADTTEVRDNMVAFISARITVDESHKIVTAYARMFEGQNGDKNNPTYAKLGLLVFEEVDGKIEVEEFDSQIVNTEAFGAKAFNISGYVGKTVTIVLGVNTGYHCCLDRIEFSSKEPVELKINGVDGLEILSIYDKVTDTEFDAEGLTTKWHFGGGTSTVKEGIQLNGTDPWRAEELDKVNPQPVNSFMYMTTDITAEKSMLNYTATIVDMGAIVDPAGEDPTYKFFPYICAIIIDSNGNVLKQTDWKDGRVFVEKNMQEVKFTLDCSAYVGEDITVVIAANVGYRATITNVSFTAPAANA